MPHYLFLEQSKKYLNVKQKENDLNEDSRFEGVLDGLV